MLFIEPLYLICLHTSLIVGYIEGDNFEIDHSLLKNVTLNKWNKQIFCSN